MTLVGLGCLATLSLPPFFLVPLLFVSMCGWLSLLLRAETTGQAFRTGWWWGVGFFISGLYWICNSLLVDAERFAWMIPFALFGLNSLIAIFPGLACLVFFKLKKHIGENILAAVFLFTVCFSLSEFARSHVLTGFPWNLVGYTWGDWPSAMQVASLFGIHGLTLLTILFSLIPLLYKHGEKNIATKILFMWMLLIAWGMWRVDQVPVEAPDGQPIMRVVQGNVEQSLKWVPEERIRGVQKHLELTRAAKGSADIIVWPESSIPFAINKEKLLQQELQQMLQGEQALITGGLRIGTSLEPNKPAIYNSVYAINRNGILHSYDKHHLVPFGEFVPLRDVLPISKISPGDYDYSRGTGPQTVIPQASIPAYSPLVCYEAIFAEEAVAASQQRPEWMVNVTNDAWFGHSTGPYQHLHMTRFRAVEQGLPLVRAANTGISAVVDSVGRVVDSIPLDHAGTIDVRLPVSQSPTLYAYVGNWVYGFLLLLLSAITFGCVRYRRLHS